MVSLLHTVEDVAGAISGDPRFSSWRIRSEGPDGLELALHRGNCVLLLLGPRLWKRPDLLAPHLQRARSGAFGLVLCGTEEDFSSGRVDRIDDPPIVGLCPTPISMERLVAFLRSQGELLRRMRDMAGRDIELGRSRYELEMLISVGRALQRERDIDSLLAEILRRTRDVTGADAGSIYVVEGDADDLRERVLRFKVSQNDSVDMAASGFTMPISDDSIVGTCVLGGGEINIPDLYALDAPGEGNNPWGVRHDRSFDEKHGYQTRSMLTVPLISAREEVIGVVQLINKRARGVMSLSKPNDFDDKVVAFGPASVALATALASQAGMALENALLYDEVRQLFEGFVRASVTAIESRDPTTSGHSQRVADLTLGLARAAERVDTGTFADLTFSFDEVKQLEYAALLHDFGKVGVREHVLVKAKKLYEHDRDLLLSRFDFIRKSIENEQLSRKVRYLSEASREQLAQRLAGVDRDARERLAEIDEFVQFILAANEPSVLEEGGFERIADIAVRTYVDAAGKERPFLTGEEAAALQLGKGSLTPEEREQIQSHVVHTYSFLKQIPWGRAFKNLPEIAGAHHEKLDGSGYPSGSTVVPVPARMMTISDIYDALTARDRPYKKSVPEARALDILGYEVKGGKLDRDLFQLFIDARVFELVR